MRYWQFSAIASNPMMPWQLAGECYQVQVRHQDRLSSEALSAIGNVALQTEFCDMPNLQVLATEDGPPRRIYGGMPTFDEWSKLERAGVIQDDDGFLRLIIDALH